jgi:hypothetical protein
MTEFPVEIKSILLKSIKLFPKTLLLFVFLILARFTFAQETDSTKSSLQFHGAVSITNKGISIIPTFTLDKPAVALLLSMKKRNLSFEPELRFAIDGKPWGFVFWWRYKLLQTQKFFVRAGAHPAIAFKTVPGNGVSKNTTVSRHYVAGELAPNYLLSKNISAGTYYLYAHGIEKDAVQHTHFLTLNSNFSNIRLSRKFYATVTPQVYYLKMDRQDGFYFTSAFAFAKSNLPLTLSAVINKTIQTDIAGSKDFVWNVSLTYSFNKKYGKT